MKKINSGYVLPSGALSISKKDIVYYSNIDKKPEVGDLIYGSVAYLGQHKTLENKQGRIHKVDDGSKAIFVYGNRYAPDMYEGLMPDDITKKTDLLARSGIVGELKSKNSNCLDCTRIKVYGYVCDKDKNIINTTTRPIIERVTNPQYSKKAKMILVVGTAMNSGKSQSAANCVWALSNMGHIVNGIKATGTASLKDILLMEDSGANKISDFSYLGYPSTYMLSEDELLSVFYSLDAKFSSHNGCIVVEFADGILQRETYQLLKHPFIKNRIHKLIFAAHDALGAIGGLSILKEEFGLVPDALSGLCASSPLAIEELQKFNSDILYFDSAKKDLTTMAKILI